jgi:5-methylcytosine-specific restriction endonuclease McrA
VTTKPRNGGTWTESKYWSQVRSHLRNAFRYWHPMKQCKEAVRRPNQSDNKRLRWEYQCNHCFSWYADKEVQVDHIIPAGSLKCADDLAPFLERLTTETGFQVLCKACHQIKTNEERVKK